MDQLKVLRSTLRASVTRQVTNIEYLIQNNGEQNLIQQQFVVLKERYNKLKEVEDKIVEAMLEAKCSEEELLQNFDASDVYIAKFAGVKNLLDEQIFGNNSKLNQSDISQNSVTSVPKCRLPKIELKKFSGELIEYLPFWSLFSVVNDDANLRPEDKFQYLLQATVVKSKARELVESYPPTAENYPKVIEALKARYGRDDLLIEVYIRELLKLVLQNALGKVKDQNLVSLYDRLESHLRSLESLGINNDKFAAVLLPLIESSLPEEILRVWQRSGVSASINESTKESLSNRRLESLMRFLKNEVEAEERIELAKSGFGVSKVGSTGKNYEVKHQNLKQKPEFSTEPTAATLVNSKIKLYCIFCKLDHVSSECETAKNMSLDQKNDIIRQKKRCYICLKFNHTAKMCRVKVVCQNCGLRHLAIMCPKVYQNAVPIKEEKAVKLSPKKEVALTNYSMGNVFLQTVSVSMIGKKDKIKVRVLIDSGSERSYILQETAKKMKYVIEDSVTIIHSLFGGVETKPVHHNCYKVRLGNIDDSYYCNFQALSQEKLCGDVVPVVSGPWVEELSRNNINIAGLDEAGPIEVIIGADILGKLLTGRKIELSNGLVAVELHIGWTVMGRISESRRSNVITSMLSQMKPEELWDLDVIGIRDPIEAKSRKELEDQVKDHFQKSVIVNEEGRYEVQMPWVEGHDPLPSYYEIALKRLQTTVSRLKEEGYYEEYAKVFTEWVDEGVIEEIPKNEVGNYGHYLPHRHVIKLGSSTPVRPVFDASTRCKPSPSINQCLEKGINLIENIPNILLGFRLFRLGVISDIRRAFLQVSLCKNDRDFLRFLWTDNNGVLRYFRHRRVVFGITCSPFLLQAVIEYHLTKCIEKCNLGLANYSIKSVKLLQNSFYMDNSVTSVDSVEELEQFITEGKELMSEGKFDLRAWETTNYRHEFDEVKETKVLGLKWNRLDDTLGISSESISQLEVGVITKRKILSFVHRPFDPIGFCCPVAVIPKILLQNTIKNKLGWDEEVDSETCNFFKRWMEELPALADVKIPRWLSGHILDECKLSIHTFCDASINAYAAVIFIRAERLSGVRVQLIQAKSRIAPKKKAKASDGRITIPRLELLAATVGARLYNSSVKTCSYIKDCEYHFWSDSTTVLAWIGRNDVWGVFVGNRVREIKSLTDGSRWRFVPGDKNPADLPSRGCSTKTLLKSKWWEGPSWLYGHSSTWPSAVADINELEVKKELKKGIVYSGSNVKKNPFSETFERFDCYYKVVRVLALVLRFVHNCKYKESKVYGCVTVNELESAEICILKVVQKESFSEVKDNNIEGLNTFVDSLGLIRLSTKITALKDSLNFVQPVVVPSNHFIVSLLIRSVHIKNCHVGVQGLLSILREKFWIIGGRRTIKSVYRKCVICQKQEVKPLTTDPCPLPSDRIRDARVFEVTGVDYAGPILLKGGVKAWICLFTCGVYRAVHFELVSSLSTDMFIQVLRRFVARRGRPSVIYSDNGRNFVGANNSFKNIDWDQVGKHCAEKRIMWKFSVPSAAWWGGWWERLVRVMKALLRKILGRASLSYEEMLSVLCDCESVINNRPLTYVSEDPTDLSPLTPNTFLQEPKESGLPECDIVDSHLLNRRAKRRQLLREQFRRRFRSEYLGQLVHGPKIKGENRKLIVGDLVLVEDESKKRISWPLARVKELIPGRDGHVRVVRLRTAKGEVLRPLRKIYPLEMVPETHDLK